MGLLKDDVGKKGTITGFAFTTFRWRIVNTYICRYRQTKEMEALLFHSVQTPSNTAATFLGDFVNI